MSTLSPLSPLSPSQSTPHSRFFQPPAFTPTLTLRSPHQIPNIPPSSTQTLFHQKLHLLHSHGVHFSPSDLHRIAGICPDLLPANPHLLSAAISFLLSEVHVSPSSLPMLFRRRPRLLLSPVTTRLRPTVYFLRSLDMTPVKDYASFLCFSVEDKFLPRLEFLQEIGFTHKEARIMARRFPQLFCCSIDNCLKPKTEFLLKEMTRSLAELRHFPLYFSFSMEDRIRPRHEICEQNRVRLTLPAMLLPGDTKFKSQLQKIVGSSLPVRGSPLWNAGFYSNIHNAD